MLFSLTASAQWKTVTVDTTFTRTVANKKPIFKGKSYSNGIIRLDDGTIEIKGDTVLAVNNLLQAYENQNKAFGQELERAYSQIRELYSGIEKIKNILNPKPPIKKK